MGHDPFNISRPYAHVIKIEGKVKQARNTEKEIQAREKEHN